MKAQVIPVLLVLLMSAWCSAMSKHELQEFSNFLRKTSSLDQRLKGGISSDEESEEDLDDPSEDAWETSGKFEGDLILNDRQRRLIVEDVAEGLSRNGLTDSTKRWPDNEVIYYIQKEHFSSDQVQAIQDGIDDLAQASCIKFRPYKKGDRDAVVIQGTRRGCFSQVGYQGGYQVLNLSGRHPVGRGCFRHGTVVHELLHTLGFYHMQSSPDRDDYINVVWENIIEPARHNFKKYNSFSVSDFGVGYDYDSVLHYSRRAFSANGRDTLVPKQGGVEIGQRQGLSDKDTEKLNKMYCDADSNNFDAEEVTATAKPANRRKAKNQPFQGHGIGYHQGKTVVIKLPAAGTFTLQDMPSYRMFDHFSKAPQAVPPTLAQGFRTGQEVTKDHPVSIAKNNTYDKTISPRVFTEGNSKFDIPNSHDKSHENKLVNRKENVADTHDIPKALVTNGSVKSSSDYDKSTNYLNEPLRKTEESIKKHAYPPKFQDFKKDYTEFLNSGVKYDGYKNYDRIEKPNDLGLSTLHVNAEKIISHKNRQDPVINEKPSSYIKDFDSSYGTKFPQKILSDEAYKIPDDFTTYEKDLEHRNDYSGYYKPSLSDKLNDSDSENHFLGKPAPLANVNYGGYETDVTNNYDKHNYTFKTDPEYHKEYTFHDNNLKPDENVDVFYPTSKSNSASNEQSVSHESLDLRKELGNKHDFSAYYEYKPDSQRRHHNKPYTIFGAPVPTYGDFYKDYSLSHYSFDPNDVGKPTSPAAAENDHDVGSYTFESKEATQEPMKINEMEKFKEEFDPLMHFNKQKSESQSSEKKENPKNSINKTETGTFFYMKKPFGDSMSDVRTVRPAMYEVREEIHEPSEEKKYNSSKATGSNGWEKYE